MAEIQKATAKVKKGSDAKYCQFVVQQEMNDNNSPCDAVDNTEKPKCEEARKAVVDMVSSSSFLSNAIIPFITEQSVAWNWKADQFSFATSPQAVCNKLGVLKYTEVPVAVAVAPEECAFCMKALPDMVKNKYNSPTRTIKGQIDYMTGLRLKFAFGTSLYRQLGKFRNTNKSTKDSFVALDKWVTDTWATKNDAELQVSVNGLFETLRTLPAGVVTHVPSPFATTDGVSVGQLKAISDAAVVQLKKSAPFTRGAAATERFKFWCQVTLPQCVGF